MQLYLDAVMHGRSEEEKVSTFLLVIGEDGREIFNTWEWTKIKDADGKETNEITVDKIFQNFDKVCLPKTNLIIERMNFFKRNQGRCERFDDFLTDLNKLSLCCDFGLLQDDMIVYKLADGLVCEKLRVEIISKGTVINLDETIELCRVDELLQYKKGGKH